jgi:hypothetical protein
MDSKSGESGSRDGEIRDNVMVNGSFNTTSGGGCSNCSIHHNLFTRRTQGSDAILGTPVFENSGTYAGHRLAAGSPGKGNASDGLDRGARINPHAAGPPPATGTAPGAAARPTVRLLSSKRFIRRRGRLRLRVGMVQAGTVALVARLRPKARSGARPIKLRAKVLRFQTAGTRKVTLRLSRDARRRFRRWGKPRLVVRTFADVARSSPTGSFRFAVRRRG